MKSTFGFVIVLGLCLTAGFPARADEDDGLPGLDVPGQEQKLNAELWRFAKNTSYEEVQKDLPAAQGKSRAGTTAQVTLPNGWRMAPAGGQLELDRYPMVAVPFAGKIAVLNNGYYYVTSENQPKISVCDASGKKVVQTLTVPSLFPSACVGKDGDLYVSGGYDQEIRRFNGEWAEVRDYKIGGFTAGVAAVDADHVAVAVLLVDDGKGGYESHGRLALLNTHQGQVEQEVDCGRMPYAVAGLDGKVFVGRLSDNQVSAFAFQGGRLKPLKALKVGAGPSAFATDGARHRLYVMNQDSDEVSVVDTRTLKRTAQWSLRQKGSKFGAAPTSGWVEGNRLYVTLSRLNAVAVVDTTDGRVEGYIPTGWYPTCVTGSQGNLYVLSAKGIHERRPNPNGPQPTKKREEPGYVLTLLRGSLGTIPFSDIDSRLPSWTRAVEDASPLFDPSKGFHLPIKYVFYIVKENRTYDQVLGDLGRGNGDPDLTLFGKDVSPNHHQLALDFVDLDNFFVDGEISVLGHSYTTSGYASPFLEWFGMNDYAGRLGAKDAVNPAKNEDFWPFGTVPFTYSPSYLWDAMDAKGLDYRIYGEDYYFYTKPYRLLADKFGGDSAPARKCYDRFMEVSRDKKRDRAFFDLVGPFLGRNGSKEDCRKLLEDPAFASALSRFYTGDNSLDEALRADPDFKARWADFLYHCSFDFRGWDLSYSDLKRAAFWQRDFERQVRNKDVFPLQYIWLPNDHTAGLDPKALNPYQLMAQNDAALGVILETIARSPVWKQSLVVCVEDDSQNGPDHVDAMRTVALAAGPSVKRGAVVSDLYDQLGLLKTMEMILGLDPLNMNDASAAPLFSIFTEKPDDSPYRPPEPSHYLTEKDKALYRYLLSDKKGKPLPEALGGEEGFSPADVR